LPNGPSTLAIANAIVAFAQAITYSGGGLVYSNVSLGETKDLVNSISASGSACLEVYGNLDNSQHKSFGGKITDEQTWFLLSIVNLDNALIAEQTIYNVRDALIVPFQTHATLSNAGSVYHVQIKPGGGKFFKIFRNRVWSKSHVIEVLSRSEWYVTTPPGVTA
jgi:hypothetical protein